MANEPKPRRSNTTTRRKKDAPRNPARDEDTRREPDHPRSGQRDEDEDTPGSETDRESE